MNTQEIKAPGQCVHVFHQRALHCGWACSDKQAPAGLASSGADVFPMQLPNLPHPTPSKTWPDPEPRVRGNVSVLGSLSSCGCLSLSPAADKLETAQRR